MFARPNELRTTIICGVALLKNFSSLPITPGYRKDIVGLRAIACLFVIFNHFEIPGFTGGFIGVDIFLVISGYLITGMLIRLTEDARTSQKNIFQQYLIFLIKRTQRIFPAALGVIVLVIFGSQFILNSLENQNNKIDGFFNSLMTGNLYFADLGTNYFQSGRGESYFLHYWSLSVEWQFYLIYGLFFLFFLKKLKSVHYLKIANLFLIVSSFAYFWIDIESSKIYFSTFARAWELLLGSQIFLLNYFTLKKQKIKFEVDFTIFLILIGCVFLISNKNWYFGVLLACIVSVLLLSDFFRLNYINIFLNLRILQHLGRISYSLYLVHWPVWLFLNDSISLGLIKKTITGLILTYALSLLVFYVFEKPYLVSRPRNKRFWTLPLLKEFWLPRTIIFAILFVQALAISSASVNPSVFFRDTFSLSTLKENAPIQLDNFSKTKWVTSVKDGLLLVNLPRSLEPNISNLDQEGYLNVFNVDCLIPSTFISPDCSIGSKAASRKKLVVIGDSHAYSLLPTIQNSFDLQKWNVSLLVKANCAFALESFSSDPQQCLKHRHWVFEQLRKINPDLILIHDSGTRKNVFRWRFAMKNAINQLRPEVPIIYLSPFPIMGDFHTCLKGTSDSILGCITKVDPKLSNFRLIAGDLFKTRNAVVVNSVPWVCYQDRCPPIINSKIVSVDGGHITPVFARLIAPLFLNEISPFLRKNNLD